MAKEDNRKRLVETAMRLFRRRGYASVGLQEILRESNAPKGSLYYYFPDGKEALGEAAVELAGEMITDMLEQTAGRHKSSRAFVSAYCQQMAEWMAESGFSSGCPIATTVLETVPQSERIRAAANTAINRWTTVIARVFEANGCPADVAATEAENLVAAMEGALILARIRGTDDPVLKVREQSFGESASV